MTEEYVRTLLEERRMKVGMIQASRRVVRETDAEIIEGLSLQAIQYDKPAVQTSGATDAGIIGIIARVPIERRQARYDKSKLNAIVDAQESELEWLDEQWMRLPALLHRTIQLRYYEGLSIESTALKTNVCVDTVNSYVNRAIVIIAKNSPMISDVYQ